ncbi:MAG: sigma-54-dependent Fis family transcriptional regulator [Ignavibacteria bacterium]|nr:sigma-54-dependent Fis family transcriptional regulator [Ignavibacteria bacterium]
MTRQILKQLTTRFGIVGDSDQMVTAMQRLIQVAPTDLTVLITGETGTGKEIFAHALHDLSLRKKAAFVSVNCGAIPETLLESELFGSEKGAYTGSVDQRKGFFETAHKGTIFLDEIGEMPIGTQVKLLRILENGEFSRLGSSDIRKVDVRVVTATNRDLMYEVKQGRFRQDLFFRLNSVTIPLPPLRQHPDDVHLLAKHFADRAAVKNDFEFQGFSSSAMQTLEEYSWPGNVRELRNIVETMVTLERGNLVTDSMLLRYMPVAQKNEVPKIEVNALARITDVGGERGEADVQMLYRTLLQLSADVSEMKTVLRHLLAIRYDEAPPDVSSTAVAPMRTSSATTQPPTVEVDDLNIAKLEKTAIEMALRKTHGNRREAADMLGISERTLYRKITEYELL